MFVFAPAILVFVGCPQSIITDFYQAARPLLAILFVEKVVGVVKFQCLLNWLAIDKT